MTSEELSPDAKKDYCIDFTRRVQELMFKQLQEWLENPIKFVEMEKKLADANGDTLGERYWHGISFAYNTCKLQLLLLQKESEITN
ncbi:MAG: hypothetical protein ACYC9R_13115 [Nitrosotalea sp.]